MFNQLARYSCIYLLLNNLYPSVQAQYPSPTSYKTNYIQTLDKVFDNTGYANTLINNYLGYYSSSNFILAKNLITNPENYIYWLHRPGCMVDAKGDLYVIFANGAYGHFYMGNLYTISCYSQGDHVISNSYATDYFVRMFSDMKYYKWYTEMGSTLYNEPIWNTEVEARKIRFGRVGWTAIVPSIASEPTYSDTLYCTVMMPASYLWDQRQNENKEGPMCFSIKKDNLERITSGGGKQDPVYWGNMEKWHPHKYNHSIFGSLYDKTNNKYYRILDNAHQQKIYSLTTQGIQSLDATTYNVLTNSIANNSYINEYKSFNMGITPVMFKSNNYVWACVTQGPTTLFYALNSNGKAVKYWSFNKLSLANQGDANQMAITYANNWSKFTLNNLDYFVQPVLSTNSSESLWNTSTLDCKSSVKGLVRQANERSCGILAVPVAKILTWEGSSNEDLAHKKHMPIAPDAIIYRTNVNESKGDPNNFNQIITDSTSSTLYRNTHFVCQYEDENQKKKNTLFYAYCYPGIEKKLHLGYADFWIDDDGTKTGYNAPILHLFTKLEFTIPDYSCSRIIHMDCRQGNLWIVYTSEDEKTVYFFWADPQKFIQEN